MRHPVSKESKGSNPFPCTHIVLSGEKQSNYTLFVVILYLTLLVIYGVYAVFEDVTYSIPWAVITMVPIAGITIIRFYRFKSK